MKFLKLIKTFMLLSHIFQLKQRTISILKLFDVKANRSSRSGCHGNWIAVSLLTHQDRDSTSLSTIWSKRSRSKFFFWAYKTSQVSESNVHKFTSTCIDSCQTFDLESFKSNPFYYDKSIPSCFPEWLGFPWFSVKVFPKCGSLSYFCFNGWNAHRPYTSNQQNTAL